jgi:NAD(P)H-nitrite reductase large subunit
LEGSGGGVSSVALEDGRSFPAELVLLSTGFRANTAVAEQAGLNAGRAVQVTEAMGTSDPNIYACGDCTDRSLSTWMQSVRQGEVAGANAAGDHLMFHAEPEPAMVHTADTSLLSIGDMGKDPEGSYRLVYAASESPRGRLYVNPKAAYRQETFYALCFRDGGLAGATLIGDLSEMLFVQEAVRRHSGEAELLEELLRKGIKIHAD